MTETAKETLLPGRNPLRLKRCSGFNLIELLLSMAVIGLSSSVVMPALFQYVHRVKVESVYTLTGALLRQARLEAIKRGVPAVVAIDPDARQVVAFVDVHGATLSDPSDGVFNPQPAPQGASDFELRRIQLPSGVNFEFEGASGWASVDGFMNGGNPDMPDKQTVFNSLGSALADGAFRFGDTRGNFLEVRVSPASTARVEIRKWDGFHWKAFGEGGAPWTWK